MDLGLANKVVLISGASEGMGRGTALVMGAERARLALVARTAATLEKTAAEAAEAGAAEVATWTGDVVDTATVDRIVGEVVARFGTIDVLVNTVGLCEPVREGILAEDDGYWQRAWDSVIMAAVRACRAVVPVMQANGGGAIVNISAMSVRHYVPMLSHYSAAKIALAHFTKNMAQEFAHDGIRANAVMPGMIASEGVVRRRQAVMDEHGWNGDQYFAYVNEKYHHVTWADRLGEPEEIGNVVAFLASDRASYVNGAWLPVDGGSVF